MVWRKEFVAKVVIAVLIAGSTIAISACGREKVSVGGEYQAIFMNNGQVFFGRIENAGAAYPIVRDVYYIGRQASPDGKEVRNILVKRGSEWHSPDYMYINGQHIVLIEPVGPSSRVAQLIAEAKQQLPQSAPPAK